MDIYTATEQAYKNGYAKGLEDAQIKGEWIEHYDEEAGLSYFCFHCSGEVFQKTNYCPYCGSHNKRG